MKSSPTAVSLLLTNLRLLNYDNDSEESFPITPDVFTSLKNKGKAFEHIVYHLLRILNPEECALVCGFRSHCFCGKKKANSRKNNTRDWMDAGQYTNRSSRVNCATSFSNGWLTSRRAANWGGTYWSGGHSWTIVPVTGMRSCYCHCPLWYCGTRWRGGILRMRIVKPSVSSAGDSTG